MIKVAVPSVFLTQMIIYQAILIVVITHFIQHPSVWNTMCHSEVLFDLKFFNSSFINALSLMASSSGLSVSKDDGRNGSSTLIVI